MNTADLQPSKLGTKEHWDNVYGEELANFEEIGDEGEIWFGIEVLEKMIEWVEEYAPASSAPSILEVGSGNGTLLFGLLDAGYDASLLLGIDYSTDAVNLAKRVATTRGGDGISFYESDFLNNDPPKLERMDSQEGIAVWDLLLDKGTYDAIALGEKEETGKSPAERYPARVARLLKQGGRFLITSCNFTEDELKASFATPETGLIYHSRIQHPTFSFGGHSGSVVSSVAFEK
ncbi:S-adenosyl-L-methionine-dependent methyltransferase, partial [Crucibulum laeve]